MPVTNQVKVIYDPNEYTWLDVWACNVVVKESQDYYHGLRTEPPRDKQLIIDDYLFYENLKPEEKRLHDEVSLKARHEAKIKEMQGREEANRREIERLKQLTDEQRKAEDKARHEAKMKEMQGREEANRQEYERRKQLTEEQRKAEDKARHEAKLKEMRKQEKQYEQFNTEDKVRHKVLVSEMKTNSEEIIYVVSLTQQQRKNYHDMKRKS